MYNINVLDLEAGQGALLLNILSKYSDAFSLMVEGKSRAMSTSELYGGARIHYIFQSIFVKSLELDGRSYMEGVILSYCK
ncbi:hypothetical protein MKW98_025636, partial [Papaver atlanticum]